MIESISALFASLKAATPQILIGVAVFCGVLLFSSQSFVTTLGLHDFVDTNRAYLGGGLIAAICVLASQFAWWAKDFALMPFTAIQRMRRQARLMAVT